MFRLRNVKNTVQMWGLKKGDPWNNDARKLLAANREVSKANIQKEDI